MKTKYVWLSLISPHVNFYNNRTMSRDAFLVKKNCRLWEKEKEPTIFEQLCFEFLRGGDKLEKSQTSIF